MLHVDFMLNEGKRRHEEMLKEAEAYRRTRHLTGNRSGLLQYTGNFLVALGRKLKTQQPASAAPAYRTK